MLVEHTRLVYYCKLVGCAVPVSRSDWNTDVWDPVVENILVKWIGSSRPQKAADDLKAAGVGVVSGDLQWLVILVTWVPNRLISGGNVAFGQFAKSHCDSVYIRDVLPKKEHRNYFYTWVFGHGWEMAVQEIAQFADYGFVPCEVEPSRAALQHVLDWRFAQMRISMVTSRTLHVMGVWENRTRLDDAALVATASKMLVNGYRGDGAMWYFLYRMDHKELKGDDGAVYCVADEATRRTYGMFYSSKLVRPHWTRMGHVRKSDAWLPGGDAVSSEELATGDKTLYFESSVGTCVLFATLLLGIQRLEDTGGLPLAHQAMFEEMLECWTQTDNMQCIRDV